MSGDCLDCALFECDVCADEYGCCCGRIQPEDRCDHEWISRPESDTWECEICGDQG